MSDAAPPAWVRRLKIPSGQWRCLVGLWGFARYQTNGPTTVYPCRETLAEQTGQTVHAVAKQLRALAEAGWIKRPGKRGSVKVRLAWKTPESFDRIQDGPPRTQESPDTDGSGVDTGRSAPDPGRSEGWVQDGPQTSREHSIERSNELADDARARDPDDIPAWTDIDHMVFANYDPEDHHGTAQERNHVDLQSPTRAGGEARRADSPAAARGGGTRAGGGKADANGDHRGRGRHDHPGDGRGAVAPRYDNSEQLRQIEVERQRRGLVALEALRAQPVEFELSEDVKRVLWACQWDHMAEHAFWRRSLLEALETMSVDDLRTVLDAWNAAEPGKRPPRRELWYRGAKYRRSMEFVDAALGRQQQARSGGVAFAMDGGLGS